MKVNGLETFRDEPRPASDVDRASKLLEAELGRSADRASVTWGQDHDPQGRRLITLRLADWAGSNEMRLAPRELADPAHLGSRFRRFWGDFLQETSHDLLKPILESLAEHAGG